LFGLLGMLNQQKKDDYKCWITIYAASDSGLKRKEEQDSYAYRLTKEGSFHKKGILLALSEHKHAGFIHHSIERGRLKRRSF